MTGLVTGVIGLPGFVEGTVTGVVEGSGRGVAGVTVTGLAGIAPGTVIIVGAGLSGVTGRVFVSFTTV